MPFQARLPVRHDAIDPDLPHEDAIPPDRGGIDVQGSDPRSPVFENFDLSKRIQRWLTENESHDYFTNARRFPPEDRHDFRPRLRPPVPILTLLDDGLSDHGEDFRLRKEVCRIGRTAADICVPNDHAVSHSHAEIRRVPWKGGFQWHLVDLQSKNGTFVRCVRSVIHDRSMMLLGSRRFRLRCPSHPAQREHGDHKTRTIDNMEVPGSRSPSLVETTDRLDALVFPLQRDRLSIGRAGGGADLQIDDPLLANHHGVLSLQKDGTWLIEAAQTRNGIWVSATTVSLTPYCFFGCGEQRFRFLIP